MSNQDKPAFPVPGLQHDVSFNGMSLREYAAIKLSVPDSGTDWLDAMIEKSLLNEFMGNAMQAALSHQVVVVNIGDGLVSFDEVAQKSICIAQAMLKASKGE